MKRLFTLLLLSFAALSCEMTDENIDDLLDKRDWVVFAEGTELSVDVPSKQTVLNYKFESALDWDVKTDADWLEIDPTSGKAGKDIKIQIKVLHNKDKEGRTGYADLTLSNDESYRITINQAGEDDEDDENDEGDENENENEGTIVDIPNNQIWYTSVDGEVVEPYSGEENNFADALTTFGVNIVFNTYVDGKGVIEFDGDVTTIGNEAFRLCLSLTSVTIPDSVTSIGSYAFEYCQNLTSVTIDDSVATIGMGAFVMCNNLQEFKSKFASEDGRCLINDGTLNAFAPAGLTEYTIPDSVTSIGGYAFNGCSSLTSVTIPDSVTEIGDGAFWYCSSLTSVTIGDSVTEIGWSAFEGCISLTSVTLGDNVTTIGNEAFRFCISLTSVTIPDSVTTIGGSAFHQCSSLTSVTIPDSVTEIGYAAFAWCSNLQEFKNKFASEDGRCLIIDGTLNTFAPAGLTEYTIPDSVTSIGDYAFNGCISLTSVTIPDSVTEIGEGAFQYCSSLKSVTIPDSVTEIGYRAFYGCSSLTSVYCKATTPPSTGGNIYQSNSCNIYVPAESYQDYISADGWGDYVAKIIPYDYENNCVIEVNASVETKRWLGKWSSTVSRTYCPQTGFNEEAVTFEVNIEHNAVSPHSVKVYGLSVIDPTIAVDGIVSANGDLEILNYCYVGNSEGWYLYMWALSEAVNLTHDSHPVYTMSMDEDSNVSCEVGSSNSSPYIMFDIFAYNPGNGSVSWYDSSLSYYSGPMSWVKVTDNGATASCYSQKVPYRANFQPQADAKLKVVE